MSDLGIPPPSPDRIVAVAGEQLERNAARLDELLSVAGRTDLAPDEAAAHAERVARFGSYHHPGSFSSSELERIVERIGVRLTPRPRGVRRPGSGATRRVLHVLTEARDIGGHTRLAWNWMRYDHTRRHDAVLLEQRYLVPVDLAHFARRSGGRVIDLTTGRPGYTRQVTALAELAASYDVVVLHHHSYDVVPGLALADPDTRPPLILVNQAGRVFATGFAVASVVAWLRPGTGGMLRSRRGVPEHRIGYVPIPLSPPSSPARARMHRRRTRRRLGIPDDAVCLVTMARTTKYVPVDEVELSALVGAMLARHPGAHAIAIGPGPTGDWAAAVESAGGRLHAVGHQTDPTPFLDAADIALDSYPISSETSVRDEALAGLPVVSLARWRRAAPECTIDLPGEADQHLLRGADVAEFVAVVDDLVADPAHRRASARRLHEAVAAEGLADGFRARVEQLYERVTLATPMTASELAEERRAFEPTDAFTMLTSDGPDEIPTVEQLLHPDPADTRLQRPRMMVYRPTLLRARRLVERARTVPRAIARR